MPYLQSDSLKGSSTAGTSITFQPFSSDPANYANARLLMLLSAVKVQTEKLWNTLLEQTGNATATMNSSFVST